MSVITFPIWLQNPEPESGVLPLFKRLGLCLVRMSLVLAVGFAIMAVLTFVAMKVMTSIVDDRLQQLDWVFGISTTSWFIFDAFLLSSMVILWRQVVREFRVSWVIGAILALIAIFYTLYAVGFGVGAYFFGPEGLAGRL